MQYAPNWDLLGFWLRGFGRETGTGDPVTLCGPRAQVDQLAALGAERTPGISFPAGRFSTDGAGHGRNYTSLTGRHFCRCDQRQARDFAQRKPIVADRWSGGAPPRVAARSIWGLLFQDPPRTLLYRLVGGPGGFRSGMME